MTTNQLTLANPRRVRLADHADAARLTAVPHPLTTLVGRLATVPGLVRPGIAHWDMKTRLPLHPLSNENAYGDPQLLHDLAEPGAAFAHRLGVDVIVGAETGGIPLATAVALAGDLPFAFVRKPGYVDHGILDPATHQLAVDALVNHWPNDDPRWTLLNHAA